MPELTPQSLQFLRDVHKQTLYKLVLLAATLDHEMQKAAAEAVGLTADKASHLLVEMGSELSIHLADRIRGRNVPNKNTELLRPELEAFVDSFNALTRLLGTLRSEREGFIRLGCFNPALKLFLADALSVFMDPEGDAGHDVVLPTNMNDRRVESADLIEQLRSNRFDYIVTPLREPLDLGHLEDVEVRSLYEWDVVAVMSSRHPLRSRTKVAPADLADTPLLLSPPGFVSRAEVERAFHDARVQPRVVMENPDTQTRVVLAQCGYGVTLAPTDTLDEVPDLPWPPLVASGRPVKGRYVLAWLADRDVQRIPDAVHNRFVDSIEGAADGFRPRRQLRNEPLDIERVAG